MATYVCSYQTDCECVYCQQASLDAAHYRRRRGCQRRSDYLWDQCAAYSLASGFSKRANSEDDLLQVMELPVRRKIQTQELPPEPTTYDRIVERTFSDGIFTEYDRLEKELSLGNGRSDYGTLVQALDKAQDNARLAHRLFVNARLEAEKVEIDSTASLSTLWEQARGTLENQKEEGKRKKQITDSDVRYYVAENFREEWQTQETRRIKAKYTKEHLERLAELWKSRAHTLEVMIGTMRR